MTKLQIDLLLRLRLKPGDTAFPRFPIIGFVAAHRSASVTAFQQKQKP
ncbi:hypothetical protein HTT03_05505 [Sulfitobacter sp. S0837]|nr:hypothetical protein [Sulfitobacter maritimus]